MNNTSAITSHPHTQINALLAVLLITLPLSAHSYERGALAPKDPPLMPTIVVYSGTSEASEPSTASTPTPIESSAPAPIEITPPAPQHPAPSVPIHTSIPTPASAAASTAAIADVASPASRASARHHFIQLVALTATLLIVGALIWWLRRPYTPPHARRKANNSLDIDLDLDT